MSTVSAEVGHSVVVSTPDPTTLKVDSFDLAVGYTVDGTSPVELEGAEGIGFGSFGGSDELGVIWGRGAFALNAANVLNPSHSAWTAELSGQTLVDSPWVFWQYGKWLWVTNPTDGVYYRTIGGTDWAPLYKDAQSPGSTGDAVATTVRPEYDEHQVFDAVADTITGTASGPTLSSGSPEIATGGYARISTDNWLTGYHTGYLEFEVTLGTTRDLSKAMALGYEIASLLDDGTTTGGNDGFSSTAASNSIVLTNAAAATWTGVVKLTPWSKMDQKEGKYYAWVDLDTCPSAVLATLKKIKIRFGIYQTGRGRYRLNSLLASGVYYHDGNGVDWDDQTATNTEQIEYGYDYTEGLTARHAKLLTVASSKHLGDREYAATYPYLGSVQSIRVPMADSPYTSAATINLYRKVGANWQRIATGPNTEDLVFEDYLADTVIAADTTTYPITTLDFTAVTPSFSGVATGVVCGCAWKGSNVYSGDDGKIYFSRTNEPTEVLWENVVLTNDPGSEDMGPSRTSTLADNTTDYALCLVPAENLYCFTSREGYVFVSGDTAANSSFPRKIDGVRGALGIRAACVYGDRALVGCSDGLWLVKKSSDVGNEPDELIEVTKDNRGAWKAFIATDREKVIVRQHLGEIWCFNGPSYYHVTRDGAHILGRWADGRQVVDAVDDQFYGLMFQLSDGAVGVIDEVPTDGGLLVAGTDGTEPSWTYTTGRRDATEIATRVSIRYRSEATPAVQVDVIGQNATSSVVVAETGENFYSEPFDRGAPEAWRQFKISGGAKDVVVAVDMELVPRKDSRNGGR